MRRDTYILFDTVDAIQVDEGKRSCTPMSVPDDSPHANAIVSRDSGGFHRVTLDTLDDAPELAGVCTKHYRLRVPFVAAAAHPPERQAAGGHASIDFSMDYWIARPSVLPENPLPWVGPAMSKTRDRILASAIDEMRNKLLAGGAWLRMQMRTVVQMENQSLATVTDVQISDTGRTTADERRLVLPAAIEFAFEGHAGAAEEQHDSLRKWRTFPDG